jgi:hypothetical protein
MVTCLPFFDNSWAAIKPAAPAPITIIDSMLSCKGSFKLKDDQFF